MEFVNRASEFCYLRRTLEFARRKQEYESKTSMIHPAMINFIKICIRIKKPTIAKNWQKVYFIRFANDLNVVSVYRNSLTRSM